MSPVKSVFSSCSRFLRLVSLWRQYRAEETLVNMIDIQIPPTLNGVPFSTLFPWPPSSSPHGAAPQSSSVSWEIAPGVGDTECMLSSFPPVRFPSSSLSDTISTKLPKLVSSPTKTRTAPCYVIQLLCSHSSISLVSLYSPLVLHWCCCPWRWQLGTLISGQAPTSLSCWLSVSSAWLCSLFGRYTLQRHPFFPWISSKIEPSLVVVVVSD